MIAKGFAFLIESHQNNNFTRNFTIAILHVGFRSCIYLERNHTRVQNASVIKIEYRECTERFEKTTQNRMLSKKKSYVDTDEPQEDKNVNIFPSRFAFINNNRSALF